MLTACPLITGGTITVSCPDLEYHCSKIKLLNTEMGEKQCLTCLYSQVDIAHQEEQITRLDPFRFRLKGGISCRNRHTTVKQSKLIDCVPLSVVCRWLLLY